jgi:hypothetical protein
MVCGVGRLPFRCDADNPSGPRQTAHRPARGLLWLLLRTSLRGPQAAARLRTTSRGLSGCCAVRCRPRRTHVCGQLSSERETLSLLMECPSLTLSQRFSIISEGGLRALPVGGRWWSGSHARRFVELMQRTMDAAERQSALKIAENTARQDLSPQRTVDGLVHAFASSDLTGGIPGAGSAALLGPALHDHRHDRGTARRLRPLHALPTAMVLLPRLSARPLEERTRRALHRHKSRPRSGHERPRSAALRARRRRRLPRSPLSAAALCR